MSRVVSFLMCCVLVAITANFAYARSLDEILSTGVLKVGTTGDYKPFSFNNAGNYEGFDIAVAKSFASKLGVKLELINTSWPTLMGDLKEGKYDIGMSGITRTVTRQKEARFSQGYVMFGKTPLVAASNAEKYASLADIDQKGVKIGVNPGGTNEKFVKANIHNAEVILYESNLAIPEAVAAQEVDVMITDSVEALYYAAIDAKLSAPLADKPFTRAELGYLMSAGAERLQDTVNFMMDQMILKGEMATLKKEYLHMAE
ncbi:transporter substrate-binding domain-containing protein [Desulfogranum marinum]|uniref:transporter substrate-binding domain-containing protein n=1 Tax=Desulfogranum marinum TaxID=453220 RepID=UPI001965B54B|nr:transporter substrate-binding domain-containing protein [Desulfogranum marinum]MBM9514467.1 transporter substrate-binding domain-containing protein [Desulfogranum marinum]